MYICSSALLGEMCNSVIAIVTKATKDIVSLVYKQKNALLVAQPSRESLHVRQPRVEIWPIDEEQRACDRIASGLPSTLVAMKNLLEGLMYVQFGGNKAILFDLGG